MITGIPWFGVIEGVVSSLGVRRGVLSVYTRSDGRCGFLDLGDPPSWTGASCLDASRYGWVRGDGRVFNLFNGASYETSDSVHAYGWSVIVVERQGRFGRKLLSLFLPGGGSVDGLLRLQDSWISYWGSTLLLQGRGRRCVAVVDVSGSLRVEESECIPSRSACLPGVVLLESKESTRLIGAWGVYNVPLNPSRLLLVECSRDGGLCLLCGRGEVCLVASSSGISSVRVPGGVTQYLPLPGHRMVMLVPRTPGRDCILIDEEGARRGGCRGLVYAEASGGLFMAAFHGGGVLRVDGVKEMVSMYPKLLLLRLNDGVVVDFSRRISAVVRLVEGNKVSVSVGYEKHSILTGPEKFRVSVCSVEGRGCIVEDSEVGSELELVLPPNHNPRSLIRVFLEPCHEIAGVIREEVVRHKEAHVVVERHTVRRITLKGVEPGELYLHVVDLRETNPYSGMDIRYRVEGAFYEKTVRRPDGAKTLIIVSREPRLSIHAALGPASIPVLGLDRVEMLGSVVVDLSSSSVTLVDDNTVKVTITDQHVVKARCLARCRDSEDGIICMPGCRVQLTLRLPGPIYTTIESSLDKLVTATLRRLSADYILDDVDLVRACIALRISREGALVLKSMNGSEVVHAGTGERVVVCRPYVQITTPAGRALTVPESTRPQPRMWIDGGGRLTVSAPGAILMLIDAKDYSISANAIPVDPIHVVGGRAKVKVYYPGGVATVEIPASKLLLLAARAAHVLAQACKLA